ncbi:MAG TPA: deoxyribose-phosphate aldolase [Acidobacteriota bacterium]|nr:deoxyribose-phosphate aldolase [Acidobacteriota bacterium]
MQYTLNDIAKMIDHSLLNPTLNTDQLEQGIQAVIPYSVASICIVPYYLKRCVQLLEGSPIKSSTTIGFPHGVQTIAAKVDEAEQALRDGAQELDAVVNISQVVSENWEYVRSELKAIIEIVHSNNQKVKIIFENCYLADPQKIKLCEICGGLNADWVKTSTGFGTSGATVQDVRLMRQHSPSHVQIKAAGGIRDLDSVLAFREAGATRIGTSRTIEILEQCQKNRG